VKVSVLTITYNQEAYISDALEGILMQETDFDFEIVVGEDCSTDRTREVLLAYQQKYPDKIRLLLHDRNMGAQRNFQVALAACRGEYIAFCEGDDYWTDKHKLQRQVAIMDANPNASMSFHRAHFVTADGTVTGVSNELETQYVFTIEDVIRKDWFILSCSMFFRRSKFEIPSWWPEVTNGDYAIHLLCALKGEILFSAEVMGAYRKHGSGLSDTVLKVEFGTNSLISLLDRFNAYTSYKYDGLVRGKKRRLNDRLVEEFAYKILESQNWSEYWEYYRKIFRYASLRNPMHVKYLLRYGFFPRKGNRRYSP
jgi:glycosyltransferase involved in cell wall biosynthesis